MNRSSLLSPGLWLTAFLASLFVVAGCWAKPAEVTTPADKTAASSETKVDSTTPVSVAEELNLPEPRKSGAPEIILAGAETTKPAAKSVPAKGGSEKHPGPMLEDWTIPKVVIVLSGEQNGYLEPCGCSEKQSGGFARRGDFFNQLKSKRWPVTAFDLGGTLKRSRKHDVLKFHSILKGLELMQYRALGLGPAELRLGPEELLAAHAPDKGLAFVSANIVFFGSADLGTPLPYRIVEVNGVKIGVTSVLSDYYRDQVIPRDQKDPNAAITVSDYTVAAAAALEKINEKKPDLRVLLSYCKVDETKALAEKVPGFDIIITAGGPEEPLETSEQIGKSMLVQVGGKGKHVAVVGYYPDNKKQRLKYELIDLDKTRFRNDPRMVNLMQEFQDRLQDENLGEHEKGVATTTGAGFEGAKKCGECHTKAYKKWSGTDHAQAFQDLKTGPRHHPWEGKWISREFDTECLACHVTGWDPKENLKLETGFASFASTPLLAGQQCENCHGPGSEHVKTEELLKKTRKGNDPNIAKWRSKMHLDTKMAQEQTGCYKCHDGDNSPKFKFEEYYKKIEHRTLKD